MDEEKKTVTAPIAVLTVDRDGEVVEPKAFEKRFDTFLDNPVVLWAHLWKEPAIGNMVDYELSDEKLLATTKFADHEFAKTIESLYMGSFLRAFSVGFLPWETVTDKRFDEQKGDTIVDAELLEYSTVNIPSNREALVKVYDAVKSQMDTAFLPYLEKMIDQSDVLTCGHKALFDWEGTAVGCVQCSEKELIEEEGKETNPVELKRRSVKGHFMVTGDTDVTNDHRHIYEILINKAGQMAGRTWGTLNTEKQEWVWEGHHIHLIVGIKRCGEEEGHTHSLGISLDAMAVLMEDKGTEKEADNTQLPLHVLDDSVLFGQVVDLLGE